MCAPRAEDSLRRGVVLRVPRRDPRVVDERVQRGGPAVLPAAVVVVRAHVPGHLAVMDKKLFDVCSKSQSIDASPGASTRDRAAGQPRGPRRRRRRRHLRGRLRRPRRGHRDRHGRQPQGRRVEAARQRGGVLPLSGSQVRDVQDVRRGQGDRVAAAGEPGSTQAVRVSNMRG